jgi:hypothetical protein
MLADFDLEHIQPLMVTKSLVQPKPIFSWRPKATNGSFWGGLEKTVLANKLVVNSRIRFIKKAPA